jgi:CBS domain containing-hemolysin-like protein
MRTAVVPFLARKMGLFVALATILFIFVVPTSISESAPVPGSDTQLGQTRHLTMMVVYAAVALIFSFLCSVAEAVVLSVSPSYIANLRNTGKKKTANLLRKIKTNIDRSLAAILTLNTIAHTVGAGGAGAEAAAYFGEAYVGIAMAVLTLLILFLSEIIPKTLGAVYWRSLAPVTAQFVQLLIWVLFPLIYVSELLTKWLARGTSPHAFNRDEFTALVDIGARAGQLDATESRILNNLFRFPELCAEDIMTPRTVVFALQQDLTVSEVMQEHQTVGFTRIPLYADNVDEVTGFALKTDILLNQHDSDGKAKLRDLKREIRGVHERTPLSKVLEDLLDMRSHILLVVDDYGGMEGIVTLEDVVETLIGIEIVDEADTIDDMRRLARQKWEERMKRVGIDVREPESPEEEEDVSN